MKFCKDCKWGSDISGITFTQWGCRNEKTGAKLDPVDGRQIYRKCGVERAEPEGSCGPDGALWEAK